jgi:uncharacterized repeat protein (TIGR02543 family)
MTRQELKLKKSNKQPNTGEQLIMFRHPTSNVVVRRVATAITAFALSLSGLVFSPAQAAVPDDGDYSCATGALNGPAPSYTISGRVVSNGGSCTGAVLIPEGVISIGNGAFQQASSLTSINLPSTLTSIGDYAFESAGKLESLTIPASVQSIGVEAFQRTRSLKSINIPEGITTIPDKTFFGSSLLSIVIPASVETVNNRAFQDAFNLRSVTFEPGSELTTIGEYAFYETKSLASITIPADVTSIGRGAFGQGLVEELFFLGLAAPTVHAQAFTGMAGSPKAKIKSGATGFTTSGDPARWNGLAISEVTDLGSYGCASGIKDAAGTKYEIFGGQVFNGRSCTGAVVLPANLTSIGANAFSGASISSITIPSSVTRIEGNAFSGASISSINIPSGVTLIGNGAFQNNENLATVSFALGSTLKTIGADAFREPKALTKITIPQNVTNIGDLAFYGASELATVAFEPGSKLTRIGAGSFWNARKLTSITIPSGVTAISNDAFRETGLTSVSIPAAVFGIGERAFQDSALTTVTFAPNSGLFVVGTNAFQLSQRLTTITIPASLKYADPGAFSAFDSITIEAGNILEPMQSANWTPSRGCATFGGWTTTQGSSTTITFPYTPSTSSSTTLFAKWTVNANSVVYDSKGGTAVTCSPLSVLNSSVDQPTAPTRAGYTFAGWTETDGAATTVTFPYAPSSTAGITLYAKWLVTYSVTYNSKGGTAVANGSFTTGGNFAAPTAPTRAGFTFAGWTATDGGSAIVSFPYAPSATSNITLYAKWTQNPIKAVASTKPSVTGKAIATTKGTNRLTAAKGTWTGFPTPVISYQWYSCTAEVKTATSAIPKTCKSISKATTSTLAVTNTYKGKFLAVAVTGKGTGTTATTWLSKSTAKVK